MSRLLLRLGSSLGSMVSSQIIPKRNAGHSKWANIRHTKAAKDGERSELFRKFGRQIRLAIVEGGHVDPKKNSKLKSVMEIAKKNNMPSESVQRILKASEGQDIKATKSSICELRGPGGCLLVVSFVTNNINATLSRLKCIYRKCYFQDSAGIVKTSFEHKGIITAMSTSGKGSLEQAMEHAIEAGAEDVSINEEENTFEFITDAKDVFLVQAQLSLQSYEIVEASCQYRPLSRVKLPDDAAEAIAEMCDKLMGEPEVVDIVDNIE